MPEGPATWLLLEHEAPPDCLLEPLLAGKIEDEREVETESHNGRDFERLAGTFGEPFGSEEHRVAHGLR